MHFGRGPLLVLLGPLLLLTACGSGASSTASSSSTTIPAVSNPAEQRKPQQPSTLTPGVAIDIKGALASHTAVAAGNWADPFAFIDSGRIYTYATNTAGANIPVAASNTDGTASYLGDAMPRLASWTHPGAVWAPSVYKRSDGTYVMFYDSLYGLTPLQCVGVATATSPAGPFVDSSDRPLVCPTDLGGAIDASMLAVDGTPWLVYKADGNCCNKPTSIWSVQLSSDLQSTVGQPTKLLSNDQGWEGAVVEAPSMVHVGGTFYLFYSGNDWSTKDYAIGYAVCRSVTGPCSKPRSIAWGPSFSGFQGPGGASFLTRDNSVDLGALKVGDDVAMVFHGWPQGKVDPKNGERELFTSIVTFTPDGPTFATAQ